MNKKYTEINVNEPFEDWKPHKPVLWQTMKINSSLGFYHYQNLRVIGIIKCDFFRFGRAEMKKFAEIVRI